MSGGAASGRVRSDQEERNLALATEMYQKVLIPFDSTHVDRYIAPDYIQHSTLASDGREALKAFLDAARRDFPEARLEIKRSFVDGDYVIFHVQGSLRPQDPPSVVVDIFRLEDGLIREHWDVLQQLPATMPHANGAA